jgi:hypothetical protein
MSETAANVAEQGPLGEWRDADGRPLREGAFYWALPVHPDTDLAWQSEEQPALFAGGERWFWIGVTGDGPDGSWPARWVGHAIGNTAYEPEMIERVARALCSASGVHPDESDAL